MKDDWSRLADHVITGRVRKGFGDRRAFAAYLQEIGHPVTERTLGNLEAGKSVSMSTVAAIEIGLGWSPGSGRATLQGGEPTKDRADAGHAEDTVAVDRRPEIPPYVTRENTEDWEWEIWDQLFLLPPRDKEVVIEFVKGLHRRAAQATEDVGQAPNVTQRTG
jgi:hypothetical protein